MKLSVLAIALVSIAALSSTAVRADERQPTRVTLSVTEAEMKDSAAVAKLYKRLERSSKDVCTSEIDYDQQVLADDAVCAKNALDKAIASVNDKRLIAYHAQKSSASSLASGGSNNKGELDD